MKKIQLLGITCLCLFIFSSCVKDTGTVEVTYQEATAIYGNLDEVRNIELNVAPKEVTNPGKIFIAEDYVLIGEEGVGIHVVDNTNRANPSHTSFINIPGNKEYFVEGNILYAETNYDVLKIDISNPNQVSIISRAEEAIHEIFEDENGNALLGFSFQEKKIMLEPGDDFYNQISDNNFVYYDFAQNIIPKSAIPASFAGNSAAQSGTVNRINKSGDYIYLISNDHMIVIDDNNFEQNFVKHEYIMTGMETVFPYQDNLFVGSRDAMTIFSLDSPMNPIETYSFTHATSCDPVLPHNEVAYITLRTAPDSDFCQGNINSLIIVDIDDISNPRQINEMTMQSPYGMSIIGNQLFIGEGTNGLKVLDISTNAEPEILKEYPNIEAYDIIADPVNSNIIFIAGPNGLNQFILDEELNLELQSTIDI